MTIVINKGLILENISAMMKSRAMQGNPMTGKEVNDYMSGNKTASAEAAISSAANKNIEKISGINGVEDPLEKAKRLAKFGS